jgi:small-conductance mechanosensitive channel
MSRPHKTGPLARALAGAALVLAALTLPASLASSGGGEKPTPLAGVAVAQTPPTLEPPSSPLAEPAPLDRKTPRRTLEGFLKKAKEGDFRLAASYLDLRAIPPAQRDREGPELARKLAYVMERQTSFDPSRVSDEPEGDPSSHNTYTAGRLYAGEEAVPIDLRRVRFPDGVERWLIAEPTVQLIPKIDAVAGPRPIVERIPQTFRRPTVLGNELWQWLGLTLGVLGAYIVGRFAAAVVVNVARVVTRRMPTRVFDALMKASRRPLRLIFAALVYRLLLDPLQLTAAVKNVCEHIAYTTLVVGLAWLALRSLGVTTVFLEEREARQGLDAFIERRIRTRTVLLRRIAGVTVGFVAFAFLVIQFDFVRSVGVSILASAGVFSLVVGLAAQRTLGAIIGGIQFSVAQPVRVSDHVVVEGEFGDVEEIHLTYVVVRLWDKRRLVLPTTYFLERPFQNWTRSAMDIVGSVVLKVDYSVPVDAVREELRRICDADPLWDRQTCEVHVTDADATSLTLRAMVSADDAARLWDLRCRVREYLAIFVHRYSVGSPA